MKQVEQDRTAPKVSTALVTDTGSSATDKITSNPAMKGTGEANTLVTIKEGGTTLGTAAADSTGLWSFTPTGLADGAHTLSATQTDLAGNTGTVTLSFTLDRTTPKVSTALVTDTGSSATDKITSNPAMKGTGEANTLVTIKEGDTTLGTAAANSTGLWSFTPTGLADGAHTLSATQTDLAGNTGTVTLSFTLDRTAPKVSTALVTDTGSSATDKITSNPAMKGTGEANTLVTIKEGDTTLGTAAANSTGLWSFTPTGLADGAHTLSATQTDLAGNTGTATLSFTLEKITLNPAVTGSVFALHGFAYTSWFNGGFTELSSKSSLDKMSADSANATSITSTYYVHNFTSNDVYADPTHTELLDSVSTAIDDAHARGLDVMLKPHVDLLDGVWRGQFEPTDVSAFFASYKTMIMDNAHLAQAHHVEILSLGCEMDQLCGPAYTSYWTDIIDSVRSIYDGALTYSSHWFAPASVSFWDQLDYVGINPYVPLSTDPNATVDELVAAWNDPANPSTADRYDGLSSIQYYEALSESTGKPLLVTEIGYTSSDTAGAQPGINAPDAAENDQLQSRLYDAFFKAWTESGLADKTAGVFVWNWFPVTDTSEIAGWSNDLSIQGKPAEATIAGWFAAAGGATPVSTSESTTVDVRVSGDSFQGAPEITLVIDQLIAGTKAVTAAASLGQWQTLTFDGAFREGDLHSIQIYYDNDLAGAGGDRNVYIDWVEVNGTRIEAEDGQNTASLGDHATTYAPMWVNGVVTLPDYGYQVDPR